MSMLETGDDQDAYSKWLQNTTASTNLSNDNDNDRAFFGKQLRSEDGWSKKRRANFADH